MTLRASLALGAGLALLAAPTSAQTLTRSDGVLGSSSDYSITGASPFGFYALGISISEGPTPMAIFDPGNPDVLTIGLELLSFWAVGPLDGNGEASTSFPLPANPSFNGTHFFAQMIELSPPTFGIGPISNRVGHTLGFPGYADNTIGDNVDEYFAHTIVTLQDGRVLQTGGYTIFGQHLGFSVFDPDTETFETVGGAMQNFRTQHTATVLNDGRVLITGGADAGDSVYDTVDIWDPVTETVTPGPPMAVKRARHTANLLPDGRVLIAGGIGSFSGDVLAALASTQDSCEIFDPVTDTWSTAADLPKPRVWHASSVLGDGRVLVTGGIEVTTIIIPIPNLTTTAYRYDHTSDQWLATAPAPYQCALHAQITLVNGDAMIGGGADGDLITQNLFPLASTAQYSHTTNTWTQTADFNEARAIPSIVNTGFQLVVASGFETMDLISLQGKPVDSYETAAVLPLFWTTHPMIDPREHSQTVVIDGGARVLTTSMASTPSGPIVGDKSAEIFVP